MTHIDELQRESMQLFEGMSICNPRFDERFYFDTTGYITNFQHCYATNNGICCWVENNKVFVTYSTQKVLKNLKEEGFQEKVFGVPLSNGEVLAFPKLRERWKQMYYLAEYTNSEKA